MASYSYEALDIKTNKVVKGSIEADNPEKARNEVKKLGYTPLEVKEQGLLDKDINIDFSKKPGPRDLSVFCRQFVSMIRAGVTLLDALRMLADSTENKKLKAAVQAMRTSVEKGELLSVAVKENADVFPSLMENMVAAGEASGSLDIAIERMANQYERSSKTQGLIKKAMIYPIVLVVVMIAVVIVMLVKVIPSYVDMFDDLGTELPGITVAVMKMSDGLMEYWMIIVPIIIAIVVAVMQFAKSTSGQYFFGKLALKIPAVSNLVVKSASAQMARTLSTLLAAGIPLVEAVDIVANIMTNLYFRDALTDARDEITIGQPLSRPLEDCGLFPPMVYYMVRIGEETGNTEDMLDTLANYYEEEVELAVQGLMAAMEPAIIIVMAGIVGVLLGACMAPMLTMYDALNTL